MININYYKEFINEGIFSGFRKSKSQVIEQPKSEAFFKLMKMIEKIDPAQIILNRNTNSYIITKRFRPTDENDPLGEEIDSDDIKIIISFHDCHINDDRIPLSTQEIKLLHGAVQAKHKAHQISERELRIKNALDKL
jgi:hypothetical protein